jgi:hypothetical protein
MDGARRVERGRVSSFELDVTPWADERVLRVECSRTSVPDGRVSRCQSLVVVGSCQTQPGPTRDLPASSLLFLHTRCSPP